jgi:hypothetical protein
MYHLKTMRADNLDSMRGGPDTTHSVHRLGGDYRSEAWRSLSRGNESQGSLTACLKDGFKRRLKRSVKHVPCDASPLAWRS